VLGINTLQVKNASFTLKISLWLQVSMFSTYHK